MRMPFDSEEARQLNKEIHETIYYAAMTASKDLSKKDGPYETYEGCLLYTSDAADERSSVDLGGRRIITKKKTHQTRRTTTQYKNCS